MYIWYIGILYQVYSLKYRSAYTNPINSFTSLKAKKQRNA